LHRYGGHKSVQPEWKYAPKDNSWKLSAKEKISEGSPKAAKETTVNADSHKHGNENKVAGT
jgi:hypothetical protein